MRASLPGDYADAAALLEHALAQDPDNTLYFALMCEEIGQRISMARSPPSNADTDRMFACVTHGRRQPTVDRRTRSRVQAAALHQQWTLE